MAHSLDETDRQIIALLQRNGRQSNVEVARSLGLAEGTVRKRLDRLLGDGIIRIMALTDPATVGLPASVIIGIQAEVSQMGEVARRLAAIPEVRCVNIVTGTFDVMIEAVLPSGDYLLSFLIDKVSVIPGVRRTETSHVLKTVKQSCDWELPEQSAHRAATAPDSPATPDGPPIPGAIVVST